MGTEQDSRHHRKLQDHDKAHQIEGLVAGMHHGQRSAGENGGAGSQGFPPLVGISLQKPEPRKKAKEDQHRNDQHPLTKPLGFAVESGLPD